MNLLAKLFGARGATEQKGLAPIPARPSPPERPAPDPEKTLRIIINPEARDRWMTGTVRHFTPEQVERTIRGAMMGNLLAQWEMFDLMEATWPRLSKNLNELKDAVKGQEWPLQPWAAKGQKPTIKAQRRADLVEDLVWNMTPEPDNDENDFEGLIGDLLDAWGKGISVQELLWEVKAYDGGKAFAPRATRWVHPRHYGYPSVGSRLMLDSRESGVLLEADGGEALEGYVRFPENKFLIAVAKNKSGHPAGASLLRVLGFFWAASNFTWEWFLNFAQIFGMPIRWANYDPNASKETIDLICDMLANMGSAGWAAFPSGTTMELKEAMKAAGDNPHIALLKAADTICDIIILGQTLTTDAGDRGTQALGTVHKTVLDGRKLAAANFVGRILNRQLIPAICLLNFGNTEECPYFMTQADEPDDSKAMAERDQILLNAGVEMPKAWFYERHEIPMPGEGEDVVAGRNQDESSMTNPGDALALAKRVLGSQFSVLRAKDATELLTERVMEDLTSVEAKWLAGVKPYFQRLVTAAEDQNISDEDFVRALAQAQNQIPELFRHLDAEALRSALEKTMGAAMVNGAVQGAMRRRVQSPKSKVLSLERGTA